MSDDTADLLSGFSKPKKYSPSDVNAMVRNQLEGRLADLMVEGEIGNFTRAGSGHLYFSVKDSRSQLRCVMWRGMAGRLRFEPEQGMQVILRGDIKVYEPRGEYQLVVGSMEPAGVGALQLAFEQLKEKLQKEGLFDEDRKQQLPFLPRRIGIVTSPSGAAIRDVLTVLNRRHPNIQVTIYPSLVQGEGAAAQIAKGIETLDRMRAFDVLIITRGGGSLEDLWAFNEEVVARAIAACRTPLISAVGHEVDFTIADFVADLRAPTPSAAAEIVVGRKDELQEWLNSMDNRLRSALAGSLRQVRAVLRASEPARLLASLRRSLEREGQRLDTLSFRFGRAMEGILRTRRQSLAALAAELQAYSPLDALKRGYSIVTPEGKDNPLHSVNDVETGQKLTVTLSDGKLSAQVTDKEKDA